MWVFLGAGTLYLLGVGMLLLIRPLYMFTPDGNWKEFGIGQEDRTPFPFWLFCLVWAIVCYVIVLLIVGKGSTVVRTPPPWIASETRIPEGPVELPKGYYVLNKKATKLSGVPKYVYLGEEEPSN
jgi:membrane protease YdiL (CAAX protease family)